MSDPKRFSEESIGWIKFDDQRFNWPVWTLHIPSIVTLECPECHAEVECLVDSADEQPPYTCSAQIETDFCEDCGRLFCPKCQRFPHPDNKDLIQCKSCHSQHSEANS
jgi:hypothetical protein